GKEKIIVSCLFRVLVIANQNRPEMFPRPSGRGVTANDEFLLVERLQLDPYSAPAAGLVDGSALLADDSFKADPLNLRQQRFGFSRNISGCTDRIRLAFY